jgi:hypothetical protein
MPHDPLYNALNQEQQGGDYWDVAGTLNVDTEAGGILAIDDVAIDASADEINAVASGQPATVAISAAAGAANVCNVTITVKDAAGNSMTVPCLLTVWLSDAATGAGLTATSASGTVQAKAASGQDMGTLTAKKALIVQTKANGTYILEITDTGKTGFYPCVQIGGKKPTIGAQLVAGNYG